MSAPVRLVGVTHAYGDRPVLARIDLAVEAGEFVVVLGPSGCGKTTLLAILGGFERPTHGRVKIGGRDVTALPPARRPTATVFQDYALFPHMTLAQNVAFGPRMAGQGRRARARRAAEMLDLVGLGSSAQRRPHEISGGQRQRVALARALAVAPDVLLLDEPLGALDLKLRRAMQEELKTIQRRLGTTFVHVTHDQEEALALADRLVVMRAGRIEDAGPPARVYRRPATLFAADFLGEINLIPGRGHGNAIATPLGPLPLAPPGPGAVTVCMRPEALRLGTDGVTLGPARVTTSAFRGAYARVHLTPEAARGLRLVAHLPGIALPDPGSIVPLCTDAEALLAYPQEDTDGPRAA